MADLRNQQIKDRFQSLLTTSETTSDPTTGTLQNGKGANITALTLGGTLTTTGNVGIGTSSSNNSLDIFGNLRLRTPSTYTNSGALLGRRGLTIDDTTGDTLVYVDRSSGNNGAVNSPDFYVTGIGWNSSLGAQDVGFRMRTQGGAYNSPTVGQTGNFVTVMEASHITGATVSYEEKLRFASAATTFSLGGTERMRITSAGVVRPGADNSQSLGESSFRWSEVFAGTGTINTSDATEKQDIETLSDAEQAVAVALKGLIRKYRWKEAVERKGDDARIHIGVMAQDVETAFQNEGLNAEMYGVFCKNVWYTKETEIDGEMQTVECKADDEGAVEHTRLGVRYDQLFAFILSAL